MCHTIARLDWPQFTYAVGNGAPPGIYKILNELACFRGEGVVTLVVNSEPPWV